MRVPLTWRYLLAFFCLGTLLGIGHEFAHHFAGFLICGEWGYKTFNSFELAPGCAAEHPGTAWLATLAGPVSCNYLPMWVGVRKTLKASRGEKLFGVSLIFASVPLLRIVPNLYGANDESWIIGQLFGSSASAHWVMNITIWAITIPALVMAWRTIGNRRPFLVYALLLVVVPGIVAILFGGVLEPLILGGRVFRGTFIGIPYLVWIAEVLATVGYWRLKGYLRDSPA